jgi:uncharacterized protein YjiS (DUF1127 family)
MSSVAMVRGAAGSSATRPRRWIARFAAAVADEFRFRRQVAFLLQQDERMLRDIGLSRGDVRRAVRGGSC